MTADPAATVVIVTKDRREDVLRAVASAVAQRPAPEVIVLDDGSTDGTASALREAFAQVRVERFEESQGYIVRRNQGAELASGRILVSIDDDAEFASEDTVALAVSEFSEAQIGAVAIPYVDLPDSAVQQRAPVGDGVYLTHIFRGTAYAVRRELFLELGGFRQQLVHQAEEGDFTIRLLDAGYFVRLGRAEPVRHRASATRNLDRIWFYGSRNEILFAWHNVPMPYLMLQLGKSTLHLLWLGRGVRRTRLFARGILAGYAAAVRGLSGRKPVRRQSWKLYRRLGAGFSQLEELHRA
jgi:glycosyltransferase involved in cell wall biosynthesis